MLTKWAKATAMLRHAVSNDKSVLPNATFPSASSQKATIAAKKVNGDTTYISPYAYTGFTATMRANANMQNAGIYLGSDGTAPTDEDCILGSVNTTLSASATAAYAQDADGNTLLNIDITISNTTENDVTIREVGYVAEFNFSDTEGGTPAGTSAARAYFLVDRTVLTTPMTIVAGDVGVLRYQFKYPISQE